MQMIIRIRHLQKHFRHAFRCDYRKTDIIWSLKFKNFNNVMKIKELKMLTKSKVVIKAHNSTFVSGVKFSSFALKIKSFAISFQKKDKFFLPHKVLNSLVVN
jgi:hypothetical protein